MNIVGAKGFFYIVENAFKNKEGDGTISLIRAAGGVYDFQNFE
jgi:hypothetical protein